MRIVNTYGQRVLDAWALWADDRHGVMSMEHTRSCLDKIRPSVGDFLFTSRRPPILQFEKDTSPGTHDTLLSACDGDSYRLPSPWNLFEHVVIGVDGSPSIRPPTSRPGDSVTVRAVVDAILVLSTCPNDISLTNGLDRTPRDVHLTVERPPSPFGSNL